MKKIKLSKKFIISTILIVILAILSILPTLNLSSVPTWNEIYSKVGLRPDNFVDESPLSVHFIDVGQGDCTLVKSDDFVMLIDSGEKGNEQKVISYIKSQNISTIDYLVATHPHSDHIGCMTDIFNNFEIKNVFMPRLSVENTPTTNLYEDFLNSVKSSNAKVTLVDSKSNFDIGDINFEILSPTQQFDNLNNMSVVIKLIFKNNSFIFMGDAEKEVEYDLLSKDISLKSDVIKVGHHGSSSSSTENFINAVNPKVAIISCGEDNPYGHPNIETINTFDNNAIKYKRTDINGNIVIDSDGTNLKILLEKE